MSNIYEFLLYTSTISLVALFILLIKKIFEDKLPPIWQYTIWFILLFKMILPISLNRYIFLNLPLWIETIKSTIELNLNSSYSNPFVSLHPSFTLPYVFKMPKSISDYAFIIYIIGCIFFLSYHTYTYLSLKKSLKYGKKIKIETFDVIQIDSFESAFVCGFIHPILVVGNINEIDPKILLHESFHLKYKDNIQNAIWTFFRCIHWCNPFLQYVFNVIGNDMEALCDYRVLESLQGEERREYGYILLKMANKKYARSLGTTSISNGGKNISKRIQTIARFKKYPTGMELVSICMLATLFSPLFIGNRIAKEDLNYYPTNHTYQIQKSFAESRLYRPQTVASAIDLYAKGLVKNNHYMLAQATSLELQEQYYKTLNNENSAYTNYSIFNLRKIDKNNYVALLGLETATSKPTFHFLPIAITKQNGWCVTPSGPIEQTNYPYYHWSSISGFEPEMIWTDDYFKNDLHTYHTENGTYQIRVTEQYNTISNNDLNAEFTGIRSFVEFQYSSNISVEEITNAALQIENISNSKDIPNKKSFIATNGGFSDGIKTIHTRDFSHVTNWNGVFSMSELFLSDQESAGLYVQIQMNGKIIDDFVIERSKWQWESN